MKIRLSRLSRLSHSINFSALMRLAAGGKEERRKLKGMIKQEIWQINDFCIFFFISFINCWFYCKFVGGNFFLNFCAEFFKFNLFNSFSAAYRNFLLFVDFSFHVLIISLISVFDLAWIAAYIYSSFSHKRT